MLASAVTVSLRRYPVKSMQGEELNRVDVGVGGLRGDRALALIDEETGRVCSAKNPRRWPGMFAFRARFLGTTTPGTPLPPVLFDLPDGRTLRSDDPSAEAALSKALGRPVRLAAAPPSAARLEEYWPDLDGIPHRDAVTDEAMPPGGFFDAAPVHLLTTATLARLRQLHPEGRFEARRFRPNIVLRVPDEAPAFVENGWHGRELEAGELRLRIEGPCPRCVMTTLAQEDLPGDIDVLKTAVRSNGGHVGVYATVLHPGAVTRGTEFRLTA